MQGNQIFIHIFYIAWMPFVIQNILLVDGFRYGIIAASIAFVVVFIPHSIIHLRYFFLNKGDVLTINQKSKEINFEQRHGERKSFDVNDIVKVQTVISNAKSKKGLQWYPWDDYSYSTIYLRDGSAILITSLLLPDLKWPFELPDEVIEISYYCWV